MIKIKQMYTIICDQCNVDAGTNSEYSCWGDESSAETVALDSNWIKEGDKHYCVDCWNYK